MSNGKARNFRENVAFSAVLCSLLGWGLLELVLIRAHLGIGVHLLVGVIGSVMCTITLRRCSGWRPGCHQPAAEMLRSPGQFKIHDIFFCMALLGGGSVIGTFSKVDSFFLLMLLIGGLNFVPWSRFRFCRQHFYVSISILFMGAIAGMLLAPSPSPILFDLFRAWLFWAYALMALLLTYQVPRNAQAQADIARHAEMPDSL